MSHDPRFASAPWSPHQTVDHAAPTATVPPVAPPQQAPWPQPRQQPYQQAPSGWQAPPPQPPRRRGWIGTVLTVVVVIVGALFVASMVRNLLNPSGSETSVGSDPNTVQYVNEDYTPPPVDDNPPPVPGPRDLDAAVTLVTANPVYEQSVPTPTRCDGSSPICGASPGPTATSPSKSSASSWTWSSASVRQADGPVALPARW